MKQAAKTSLYVEFQADAVGEDGFAVTFRMDDSFAGWWSITRWNLHYRHWRPLFTSNLPDLFRRVIWRKIRRN